MTRVAIVGYGFMGRTHYGAWRKCRGAQVVAVCENDPHQFNATIEGNIKGAADNSKLPRSVKIYSDYDEMLRAGGFDVVDITLPTPLHAPTTIKALNARYHVLCEKPMALNLDDADHMLAAAVRANRVLLVAQCVRFDPAYAYLRTLAQTKKYGRVIAADFSRIMSAPKWVHDESPSASLQSEAKSGGLFLDAHIHDVDYILSTFGVPQRLATRAHLTKRGTVDHLTAEYIYADGKLVRANCSFAAPPSLVWEATARVFFDRALVDIDANSKKPLTIYPMEGKPFTPKLSTTTGYEEEIRYFLTMVLKHPMVKSSSREVPSMVAADARQALALVLKERQKATQTKW